MIDMCEDLVFKGTEHARLYLILCGYHRTREHVNWQFGLESYMNWKWQSEEKVDQISFGDVWFRLAPLDLDRSHIIRSSLPAQSV